MEVLGFFCRWGLLALSGAALLGVGYIDLSAASSLPGEVRGRIITSDIVARPGATIASAGYIEPATAMWKGNVLLEGLAGQRKKVIPLEKSFFAFNETPDRPGRFTVEAVGVPYGVFGFHHEQTAMAVPAAERRLWLIDAALMRSGSPEDWDMGIAAVGAKGQVAIAHPGPAEEFEKFAVSRPDDIPLLCLWRLQESPEALAYIIRMIAGPAGPAGNALVTGNPVAANLAAAMGFEVHLIADAPPETPHPKLKWHKSVKDFFTGFER